MWLFQVWEGNNKIKISLALINIPERNRLKKYFKTYNITKQWVQLKIKQVKELEVIGGISLNDKVRGGLSEKRTVKF